MLISNLISVLVSWLFALYFYNKARKDSNDIAVLLFTEIRQIMGREATIEFDSKTGKPYKVAYGGSTAEVTISTQGKG